MQLTPATVARVATLLGREPRGLRDIPVVSPEGEPVVIRVASVVDARPFPTLFWLVDPALNYRIDQAEAGGLIARLQRRVDGDATLREAMAADHRAHIALRASYLSADDRRLLQRGGYAAVLAGKGIGGIANFCRIRCLHTWYAAHLVVPNTVGSLLEQYWDAGEIREHSPV